jgi:hypothetical protein
MGAAFLEWALADEHTAGPAAPRYLTGRFRLCGPARCRSRAVPPPR